MIEDEAYDRWDAAEMARLVRAGEVSAHELAEAARSRLARLRRLNAIAATAPEAAPPTSGPLAGVPFVVKELLAWPGLPWSMGSRLLAGNPAPGWTAYAERLRDAGLHVLASATSSEVGLLGSTETVLHGATLNPWREGLSAAGSSGGSAALVAAGVVPMAHGSDGGGSLRVPASANGVLGVKPSNGRCTPVGPDLPGLAGLVVEHVLSRSVRDSAHVLAATERTGADAVHAPVGLVEGPGRARVRVGVLSSTLLGREPDPAVANELARTAELLASLGHDVAPVSLGPVDGQALSDGFFGAAALTMAQLADTVEPLLGRPPGPEELEPFSLELVARGRYRDPGAQAADEAAMHEAARAYARLFASCDVVLSPTLATLPWQLGHLAPDAGYDVLVARTEEAVGYTSVHNVVGCPAASLPLGSHDGLPVGMHLATAPGADRLLLELAFELEAAAPWAGRKPDLAWLA